MPIFRSFVNSLSESVVDAVDWRLTVSTGAKTSLTPPGAPGINPDEIEVSVEDSLLTIKGRTEEAHKLEEGG